MNKNNLVNSEVLEVLKHKIRNNKCISDFFLNCFI